MSQVILVVISLDELEVIRKWYRRELRLLNLCRTEDVVDLEDYKDLRDDIKAVKTALRDFEMLYKLHLRRKDPEVLIGAYPSFYETFEEVVSNQRVLLQDWIRNAKGKLTEKMEVEREVNIILNVYEKIIEALS